MQREKEKIRHAIYMSLLMVLLGSSVLAAVRYASETASTASILTIQYSLCMLFCLPICLRPGLAGLKTQRFGLHLSRALAGVFGFYLLYAALENIPLVDATLLRQAAPLIVPLVMLAWNRDRIPSREWLPLIIGFIGIVVILRPGPEGLSWWHTAAFVSAAALAFSMVATFQLANTEPSSRILFYYFAVSLLCVAPFSAGDYGAIRWQDWLAMFYIGVAIYFALTLYTVAYGMAPASTIAPINYLTIVLGALWGWLLWGEVPDLWSVIGSTLVIVGGLMALFHAR
jgi:drug/metabolite transporter (DMT)-like permease